MQGWRQRLCASARDVKNDSWHERPAVACPLTDACTHGGTSAVEHRGSVQASAYLRMYITSPRTSAPRTRGLRLTLHCLCPSAGCTPLSSLLTLAELTEDFPAAQPGMSNVAAFPRGSLSQRAPFQTFPLRRSHRICFSLSPSSKAPSSV